jgi:hypothetical protein
VDHPPDGDELALLRRSWRSEARTSFTGDPTPDHDPQKYPSGDNGGESEGGDLGGETRVLVGDEVMMLLPR